jgi:hypothetical protein
VITHIEPCREGVPTTELSLYDAELSFPVSNLFC